MEFVVAFIVGGALACAIWRPPQERLDMPPMGPPEFAAVDLAFQLQWAANVERLRQRYGS
jgi:hypothetical protein